MKIILKKLTGVVLAILAVVINYSSPVTTYTKLPDQIIVKEGEPLEINFGLPVKYNIEETTNDDLTITADTSDMILNSVMSANITSTQKNSKSISYSAFGIFPLKTVDIVTVSNREVILGGQPVGIMIRCAGVLVVGFSEIIMENGSTIMPAKEAGILTGDFIVEVNDVEVDSAAHLGNIVKTSEGETLKCLISRNGTEKTIIIEPKMDRQDEQYHIGIWGRDSSSGVGTLTFIEPDTFEYGALGHSISDMDTLEILKIREGTIFDAKIIQIVKGAPGMPGELKGEFILGVNESGNIEKNCLFGLYGKLNKNKFVKDFELVEVAQNNEIYEGEAYVYTTIDNEGVKGYKCEISKIDCNSTDYNKNFIITITDEELIKKTGGIIQGMSGSPIVQDGKIIGAVTHVFVNDPTMGHGVFISSMINALDEN